MNQMQILSVLAVLTVAAFVHEAEARPHGVLSRQKRISDQRLAELETLIALSKMKSKMVTIPVGFGRVDPLKIGRRKRSIDELIKLLISDMTSEEDREEELSSSEDMTASRSEDEVDRNPPSQQFYDDSQKIARYRHLPVRLPE